MTLLTMAALGLACWGVRVLFILVLPADRLPRRARRALTGLAPATMAALVAAEAGSAATSSADSARLTTAAVLLTLAGSAWLARRRHGLLLTVGLGSAVALLLDLVVLS